MRMNLKRLFLTFLVLVVAIVVPMVPVHAEAGIKIIDNQAIVLYPEQILFMLEVESQEKINDIRLNYRVDRDSFAEVVCESIASYDGNNSSASWKWDMYTTGNLPPGASVTYWWKITTEDGSSQETPEQEVVFTDSRYQWQSIQEGSLSLFWYRGGQEFALELMAAAQTALVQLETDMGAYLIRPVNIYIYGSSSDLQGAMLYVQEWAGGLAFTNYGVVAIGISPSSLEWGKKAMVHELAHLVTHQMTNNPYNSIPVWLNEGISMYAEGEFDEYSKSTLKRAVLNGDLISVQSLASPFSSNSDIAYLSYAQSYSLVEYLTEEYGSQKMAALLHAFSQGCTYDEGFQSVYSFDMDTLDALWQSYVSGKYGIIPAQEMSVFPARLGISIGAVILATICLVVRKRQLV